MAAFIATRLMVSIPFGVNANEPWAFLAIALFLAIVGLSASYIPAQSGKG